MRLMTIRARGHWTFLSDETGFTLITVMLSLFVVSLLGVAAIAAANGDINLSRSDQDSKQAYAAAEAGINDYLAHLSADPDYWTRCAGQDAARPLAAGNAVNQKFTGTPPGTRKWRAVPGSDSSYSIELLPRPANAGEPTPPTSCSTTDPTGSMIDTSGNFRIRSTGRENGSGNLKAVIGTFRRTSFLDYVYFTDLENKDKVYLDLLLDGATTKSTDPPSDPDLSTWAADKCERHWWGTQAGGEGRSELPRWRGEIPTGGGVADVFTNNDSYVHQGACGEITFASDDKVNGPFHSNDSIQVGGSPDFGRDGKNDRVEAPAWRGSGASPVFHSANGQLNTKASPLTLPPSNNAVKAQVDGQYIYAGPTTIVLKGTTMDVTTGGNTTAGVPWPINGVIYVDHDGVCPFGYQPGSPTEVDASCGQLRVSGTYSKDLTIAAADDVVINGNLTRVTGADAVLGLIADKFVRVWHPECDGTGATTNIKIDAAILAVNHSFTVDRYDCGSPLGNLNITGAIAQKHRGIVGVGGSSISSGYVKNYEYDNKLKYRSPPYFLDPVQAAWRIVRQNEQSPAR